ncbi:MAG TPA: HAMP domain-containing sensor histidine kinase [Bacteroidales bacterium]
MVNFDLRPVIVVVAILSFILGLLLLRLKRKSDYIKGIVSWAIGCFALSASLVTISFFPKPHLYINLILFNLLIIAGQCCFLIGIWEFKGKKINYGFIIALPLLSIIQITFFTFWQSEPGLRMAINSFLYAACAFYTFFELLNPSEKYLNFVFRANALVSFTYGALMLYRAYRRYSFSYEDFMSMTTANVSFFVLLSGLQLVLTYGFIIMINIRLAEDLRKQLSIKDKMLSIIAHDLKSSINIVEGFSELLTKNIDSQEIEKSKQFAGYIKQSSIQMNGILSNLLDWAKSQGRIEMFAPEELNIRDLISDEVALINSISENKQISINLEETSSLIIHADRNMIRTIIRNLVINAIKYTNPGGMIRISTKLLHSYIEISVRDSGIGIEPEILHRLFKAEEHITTKGTAREPGSGLGLLLCKEFVEKHKGKIWAESEVEVGSTFRFTIPYKGK